MIAAALRFAPRWACALKLTRGDAKRFDVGGRLLAYNIGCPACGYAGPQLHAEASFVEGPAVESAAPYGPRAEPRSFQHPSTLRAERPLRCHGCFATVLLRDGTTIEAEPLLRPAASGVSADVAS